VQNKCLIYKNKEIWKTYISR